METPTIAGIALRDLHVPSYNPRRKVHDDQDWQDFKDSLKSKGVLQAILARPVQGKKTPYEVVAGQRRFLGSLEVFGQDYQIPALIKVMTDEEAEAASAAENLQREPMSPAEEAEAAARELARCNGDREETAKRMNMSRLKLDNRLKLMACSPLVRQRLIERRLKLGVAEMLSGLTMVKQDELVSQFDKIGIPSIEDVSAMILSLTKALPSAIFDPVDCGACAHNSARQQAMFGNIGEGHCLDAVCFDNKTEAQLQLTVDKLKDDFQRVEIVRPGDNFRVIRLTPESIGESQAIACRSCKDFGAAVSAMPNKLGKVSGGLCYGIECNETKVKDFKAAQEALNSPPPTAEKPSGAAAGPGTPPVEGSKAAGAVKPAKAEKPITEAAKPTVGLSGAVLDFRDVLYRKVVFKELAVNSEFNARFVMAIVLNSQGRLFKGEEVKSVFLKKGWMKSDLSAYGLRDAMKIMMDIPKEHALNMLPNLGAVALTDLTRAELKDLTILANPDLANYFTLNDESGKMLLEKLTKTEICAICDEIGITEKMGKTFRSISGGKKSEFIKHITSLVDFEYKGKVPNVLRPEFEK
ncbi:ParB family protein (plasmid) [Rhodoferax ferrireducens T118]|uniref:ParB family protein n=2 Tax=Rhodoferax ferrireducens TaxID=192843 RepID=Q21Q47_ALBFT|nr:ParB family protein [Rhodoferax ferrireducens T118]